jgi:hypothetical protein
MIQFALYIYTHPSEIEQSGTSQSAFVLYHWQTGQGGSSIADWVLQGGRTLDARCKFVATPHWGAVNRTGCLATRHKKSRESPGAFKWVVRNGL